MQTQDTYKILTINPGSTSTKLGLFHGLEPIDEFEVNREAKIGLRGAVFDVEVADYIEQIRGFLSEHPEIKLDAVVGRGGFINRDQIKIKGGTYEVAGMVDGVVTLDEALIAAVRDNPDMDHPSNYGIPIAAALAKELNIPAYTTDAVVADDFSPEARFSGYKGITRKSTAHFLSLKAMAVKAAEELGRSWDKVNLVCVHMGGGITVGAYRQGNVVDNTIALLGNGPFTPQRVGSLPVGELIDLCYSGRFTKEELKYELSKKGGLISYLGVDDLRVISRRIEEGDEEALLVLKAMAYQISKEIGAMYIAVGKPVNGLVFSGGMTNATVLMELIKKSVLHLAPMMVFKENLEMEAMARAAVRVLDGAISVYRYGPVEGEGEKDVK